MELKTILQLIGVYQLSNITDVYLIELKVNIPPNEIDISSFTQRDDSVSKEDWQVAYDEQFLNEDGTKVIGAFLDHNNLFGLETRVAFFMYYLDINKPLLCQFGEIHLSEPAVLPERLAEIIDFEPAD